MPIPFDTVVEALRVKGCEPQERGGGYRALCPAHDDHNPSLDVDEGSDGQALIICRSQNCSYESILRALDLWRDFPAGSQSGRGNRFKGIQFWGANKSRSGGPSGPIYEYQTLEGVPARKYGKKGGWSHMVDKAWPRERNGLTTKAGKKLCPLLYRTEDLEKGVEVYVVEGEKDANTVRNKLKLIAVSAPHGAGPLGTRGKPRKWGPQHTEQLKGKRVGILPDADEQGREFAVAICLALREAGIEARILEPYSGEGVKDITDALDNGMFSDAQSLRDDLVGRFEAASTDSLPPWGEEIRQEPERNPQRAAQGLESKSGEDLPAPPTNPKKPEDFQEFVRQSLAHPELGGFRERMKFIEEPILAWARERGDLLLEIAEGDTPMLRTDRKTVLTIEDRSMRVESYLARFGFNSSENRLKWLLRAFRDNALEEGEPVKTARFARSEKDTLYVSNGGTHIATIREGEKSFLTVQNGKNGVLYRKAFSFSPWDTACAPLTDPVREISALRGVFEVPDVVPSYTIRYQQLLLSAWLLSALAGIRPLPMLVVIGGYGSGKSVLMQALIALAMGRIEGLTSPPTSERDLAVGLSGRVIYGIDNLDSPLPEGLWNILATGSTGGGMNARRLYTNDEQSYLKYQAAIGITTRDFPFARLDILSRTLPIILGERPSGQNVSTRELFSEVLARRDAVLSWVLHEWADVIPRGREVAASEKVRGVDLGRFDEFAQVVCGMDPFDGGKALEALNAAQGLAVSDPDPLYESVRQFFEAKPEVDSIKGTAAEVVRQLASFSGDALSYQGGGKIVARKLREGRAFLSKLGYTIQWDHIPKRKGATQFEISRSTNNALRKAS